MRLVLHAIHGTGPGDAWAVGENGVITHWDGHEWRLATYRAPAHLRGVWAAARNDVWAAGANGTIVHFDGTHWSMFPSGVTQSLRALWSAGDGALWIVGEGGVILRHASGAAQFERIDASDTGDWHSVSGLGPRDVWFAGNAGRVTRWDGTTFARIETNTRATLHAMWFATGADGWIVGDPDEATDGPIADAVALHWNGTSLEHVVTTTREPLLAVWGSGPNDVWAVGANFGRNETRARRPVLHWDGNAWGPRTNGATGWYAGVWGDGAGAVWAVGCCEPLLRWDVFEWQAVTRGSMLHAPDPPIPIGDGRIRRRR